MVYCYSMTPVAERWTMRAEGGPTASAIARNMLASAPMPALSLAVADDTGIVWTEALGQADLEHGVPATPAHVFRLGSVSKAVTATVAARLVGRGLLELDSPIAYWLPDLPADHRATTMRQLLTH